MRYTIHRAQIKTDLTGLHPIVELPEEARPLGVVLLPTGEVVIFYLLPTKEDTKEANNAK